MTLEGVPSGRRREDHSELVRSMPVSPLPDWEDVLHRLDRIEKTQAEIARMVLQIHEALPAVGGVATGRGIALGSPIDAVGSLPGTPPPIIGVPPPRSIAAGPDRRQRRSADPSGTASPPAEHPQAAGVGSPLLLAGTTTPPPGAPPASSPAVPPVLPQDLLEQRPRRRRLFGRRSREREEAALAALLEEGPLPPTAPPASSGPLPPPPVGFSWAPDSPPPGPPSTPSAEADRGETGAPVPPPPAGFSSSMAKPGSSPSGVESGVRTDRFEGPAGASIATAANGTVAPLNELAPFDTRTSSLGDLTQGWQWDEDPGSPSEATPAVPAPPPGYAVGTGSVPAPPPGFAPRRDDPSQPPGDGRHLEGTPGIGTPGAGAAEPPPPPPGYTTVADHPAGGGRSGTDAFVQDEPTQPPARVVAGTVAGGELTTPPRVVGSTAGKDREPLQAPPITPDFFTRSGRRRS